MFGIEITATSLVLGVPILICAFGMVGLAAATPVFVALERGSDYERATDIVFTATNVLAGILIAGMIILPFSLMAVSFIEGAVEGFLAGVLAIPLMTILIGMLADFLDF